MADYVLSHSVSTSQHNIVVAKEKAIQIKTPRFHSVLAVIAVKVSRALLPHSSTFYKEANH